MNKGSVILIYQYTAYVLGVLEDPKYLEDGCPLCSGGSYQK